MQEKCQHLHRVIQTKLKPSSLYDIQDSHRT